MEKQHGTKAAQGEWVAFVFLDKRPTEEPTSEGFSTSVYRVEVLNNRSGEPIQGTSAGNWLVRMESRNRSEIDDAIGKTVGRAGAPLLGVTQHLHYTTADQSGRLDPVSAQPFNASPNTMAVLIPIAKSEAWWALPHDQRQLHFLGDERVEGHTAIGLRYADRIYRKLYHSRYIYPSQGFDFLTYFEFPNNVIEDFRDLLNGLRNAGLNPEWSFVTREIEVWLRKLE